MKRIDNIADARRFIQQVLEAVRTSQTVPTVQFSDAVYDALKQSGELDAWEREERRVRREALEIDEAELEPDATRRWYEFGADYWGYYFEDLGNESSDPEFMLGVPEPSWLWNSRARGVAFVSARRLARRKSPFPEMDTELAIDSGGFTELRKFGGWRTSPEEYVALVRRVAEAGVVRWAAIQDWMVEPSQLERTGLTVREHQERTIESFLTLRELAPEIRWLPVVQGQTVEQYLEHVDMYARAGVDLSTIERVGVGSICRRTNSAEITEILHELQLRGLRLHAFGLKSAALERNNETIKSTDSMAWSLRGRYITGSTGETDSEGRSLQNSQEFAEQWRTRMQAAAKIERYQTNSDRVATIRWSLEIDGVSDEQIQRFFERFGGTIESALDHVFPPSISERLNRLFLKTLAESPKEVSAEQVERYFEQNEKALRARLVRSLPAT